MKIKHIILVLIFCFIGMHHSYSQELKAPEELFYEDDGHHYFYEDQPEEVYAYSYKKGVTPWLSFLWPTSDKEGLITGYKGFNVPTLGYVYRRYSSVPIIKEWVQYREFGTMLLIMPHIGLGYEYYFTQGVSFYMSGDIGVFPYPLTKKTIEVKDSGQSIVITKKTNTSMGIFPVLIKLGFLFRY